MRSPSFRRLPLFASVAIAAALLSGGAAQAQQIKSRVLVLVDTSGSMAWHFTDNNTTGGDGDFNSRFTDILQANKNYYPGTIVKGVPDGTHSRLYAAKSALTSVINATGDIDFGLMRYAPAPTGKNGLCQNNVNCCNFATPECQNNADYIDNGGNLTWAGDCGPINNGLATNGGQMLVVPGTGSSKKSATWVDGVEDFRNDGSNMPLNGELRANGSTPLAGSARSALSSWYQPIYNFSKANPNCDPNTNVLCDPQIDCRPYVFVLMTDGADTCDADPVNGPPAAVKQLSAANPNNPVLTYVIGLAFIQGDPAIGVLNGMAQNGGTKNARFANDQNAIEAAFGDIVASSVRVEICNGKDDNCNGQIDEGFDKGAACTVGAGICQRTGVKKCDPKNNTQTACCVNDGLATCTPLTPGPAMMEVCNGKDDNCNGLIDEGGVCMQMQCLPETCDGIDSDCNGVIDNNLVDTGVACGLSLGICKKGTTACLNSNNQDVQQGFKADVGDHLSCQGAVLPQMPQCNGCDNDCDGVTDVTTRTCYDGPQGTADIGVCQSGTQRCTASVCPQAEAYGPCVGEVLPRGEICNGLDDDCNGKVDDVMGANVPCCPSGKCGVGICTAGSMQCSGGVLACVGGQGPQPETCDGLDNDCNGKVDDLASIGKGCTDGNGCPGTLVCDAMKKMVVCMAAQNCKPPVCGDDPNVGKQCCSNNPMDNACLSLPGPCMPGKFTCSNGALTCQGVVGPMAEACNCKDDDCNGKVDDNAFCPPGYDCVNCGCYGKCGGGEFKCAGGFDCINVKTMMDCVGDPMTQPCYCIPNALCNPPCAATQNCKGSPPTCHDKCEGVTCPPGFTCDPTTGGCIDHTCATLHNCKACANGAGERCDLATSPPSCVPDKCCGVSCGMSQFCEPATGQCVGTCANVKCGGGEVCVNGQCMPDRCHDVHCGEQKTCDPANGQCVSFKCSGVSCVPGSVCCMDACQPDTCPMVACPDGFKCTTNPLDCTHRCDALVVPLGQQDRVVGAGGGGFAFGCSVAPGGGPVGAPSSLPMLLFLGLVLGVPSLVARARVKMRGR